MNIYYHDKEIYWKGKGLYYFSPKNELNIWLSINPKTYNNVAEIIRFGYQVEWIEESYVTN